MATVKFIQAQKFSLSGSGASIGDTTITLQSFTQIDGTLLTTTDLGIKAFGTLEPGNGTQEEQISFTGVTQNSNGTATLTGVKSVGFVSPYTETSGLAKTHAGATTFILSNDAGFYGQILSYVDTALSSGGIPATTLVNGISTLSVSPVSAAQPVVVGDNDPRATYVTYLKNVGIPFAVASGTTTALTATLGSSISSLASGSVVNILTPSTLASGATLNINGLGAKSIKKSVNSTIASGDITAGQIASLIYDGANFQLTNPQANPTVTTFSSSGTWTKPTNLKFVLTQLWGSGGSGGKRTGTDAGGGGGGGGYNWAIIPASQLTSTVSVTVGTGGAAKTTAGAGNAGNTTSFGSYLSAYGGGGGGGTVSGNGGGGGGGQISAGSSGSGTSGGNGGSPSLSGSFGGGGAAETAGTVNSSGGGGGGGGSNGATAAIGGASNTGGGGGGGGGAGALNGFAGGASTSGGGGGGGGSGSGSAGAGGASGAGGAGGAGGVGGAAATAGSIPGGGGGGSSTGDSGAGADGKAIITEFY